MSRNDTQVNFRIRADILDRVKASAEVSGLSITSELNRLLDSVAPSDGGVVKTQIRLPADLHQFLKGAAIENEMSMNQTMVHFLRTASSGVATLYDKVTGCQRASK